MMNPRNSLRYIFGVYEHELNDWISKAIPTIDTLFDVGANHGYFSFGVMAAWRRFGRTGRVWAFEPQGKECALMNEALRFNAKNGVQLDVKNCFASDKESETAISLDGFIKRQGIESEKIRALVKVDVEGAELRVLHGAQCLVRPGNLFLVEAHSPELLERTQEFFSSKRHPVEVVAQRPLPLLGREQRSEDNWWVVTKLV